MSFGIKDKLKYGNITNPAGLAATEGSSFIIPSWNVSRSAYGEDFLGFRAKNYGEMVELARSPSVIHKFEHETRARPYLSTNNRLREYHMPDEPKHHKLSVVHPRYERRARGYDAPELYSQYMLNLALPKESHAFRSL